MNYRSTTMKTHYNPVDDGYQIVGSKEIFNRALYGGHEQDHLTERYFTFAGDLPIVMGAITDWRKHADCIHSTFKTDTRILMPELLLYDDSLMRVDTEKKENFLKDVTDADKTVYVPISTPTSEHLVNIRPRDAKKLLPVTIPAGTSKQFWLTIHAQADARPGNYKGRIKLTAKDARLPVLNLSVCVFPFKLVWTRGIISIWYRGKLFDGKLSKDGKGSIGSDMKSIATTASHIRPWTA